MQISELYAKTVDLFLSRGHSNLGDGTACEMVGDFKAHMVGAKDSPVYIGLGAQYQARAFHAVYARRGFVVGDVGPGGGTVWPGIEDELIAALYREAA